MPSLAAGSGAFVLTGKPLGGRGYLRGGEFAFAGIEIVVAREYTVDTGPVALKLDRLNATLSIVDSQGRPTAAFQRAWQRHCESIESSFSSLSQSVVAIQTAYDAASQAQAAASQATASVAAVQEVTDQAQQIVDDLQAGTLNLPSITVGGKKFVNDDSELVSE